MLLNRWAAKLMMSTKSVPSAEIIEGEPGICGISRLWQQEKPYVWSAAHPIMFRGPIK
jgi:hypothetical protein